MNQQSDSSGETAKLALSVFIIAKNEADRIHRAILSVRDWVDEVVVVDSGSTDDTVALSQKLGARTDYRDWTGYGPQKRYAESLCRNSWVLNLDADEEVTPEAAAEIKSLFAGGRPQYEGYWVKLKDVFPFETKPNYFSAYKYYVRLYNKERYRFRDSTVHDTVHDTVFIPEGEKLGHLRTHFLHRSHRSRAHTIEKINSYSSMQAADLYRKGRKFSAFRVVTTPPLEFLRGYFLRGLMFYGVNGIIEAYIFSFARFLRAAKNYETYHTPGLAPAKPADADGADEQPPDREPAK